MATVFHEGRILGGDSGKTVIIIGGGPAGLMAAERLGAAGHRVHVYDRKPSVGRKFLMAGRGGLNLTHSEGFENFVGRYGGARSALEPMIAAFTPQHLRDWCEGLGQKTFVGSSGRVFPESFKASPLLRAWLKRLEEYGAIFHLQRTWMGWDTAGNLVFSAPDGVMEEARGDAVLLAMGGASWPSLGSDGSWIKLLRDKNIPVRELRSANCGFHCVWSEIFRDQYAGQPLKAVTITHKGRIVQGDIMITASGMEGGVIYALSSFIRNEIEETGFASITIDLKPSATVSQLEEKLWGGRGKKSFSTFLQKTLSLSPLGINLLREANVNAQKMESGELAHLIKNLPMKFSKSFDIDRAISSAGGISFAALDDGLMIKSLPGVFAAGEMIDWEAPTGGYLLQACFATGAHAARSIEEWLLTSA